MDGQILDKVSEFYGIGLQKKRLPAKRNRFFIKKLLLMDYLPPFAFEITSSAIPLGQGEYCKNSIVADARPEVRVRN